MADTERSEVYLRLGSHSEKQYVVKTFRLFSGVLFGANLLESTPGATVSFALKVFGEQRAFAVDPMTYTFGMDLSYIKSETIDRTAGRKGATKVALKKSFAKLAAEYGNPIKDAVKADRPVTPADFTNDAVLANFCQSIYRYQVQRMRTYFNQDIQLQEFEETCPDPSFVFAPYFYIPFGSQGWGDWYELNVRLARAFAAIPGDIEKHPLICIDQSVLDDEVALLGICDNFLQTASPAYWLWFSALNEDKISTARARVLTNVVRKFANEHRRLYNMHGGYLSALLSKHGLTGFAHGVGYGEAKDVVPVIGVVVPTVNYHYPPLHIRTGIIDVERALSDLGISDANDFHRRVCDCTVCRGVVAGDLRNLRQFGEFIIKIGNVQKSQTADSAKKCRLHFLLARRKEIDRIANLTAAQLRRELEETAAEYAGLPQYLTLQSKARHLNTWASIL